MLFVEVQPFFEIRPVLGADIRRQERNGLFLLNPFRSSV